MILDCEEYSSIMVPRIKVSHIRVKNIINRNEKATFYCESR